MMLMMCLTRFSSSLSAKLDNQIPSWQEKEPLPAHAESLNQRKVSFHSSTNHNQHHHCHKHSDIFCDKSIQVSSSCKEFHQNGMVEKTLFLASSPPPPPPAEDQEPCKPPSNKYQPRSARNSLLKVASILSFSQFIETSKETYL